MGELLHLVQRGGNWAGPQPTQAPPHRKNVTDHPSTAAYHVWLTSVNELVSCPVHRHNKYTNDKTNLGGVIITHAINLVALLALPGVSNKSSDPKTFRNSLILVKCFCVKFCKFVGYSYPHISTGYQFL